MILCGDKQVEATIFPDGTSQVWADKVDLDDPVVWWWFENEAEFMHLTQFMFLRYECGNPIQRLIAPFLPYARQHKDIGGSFALYPFLRLLTWANGAYDLDIVTLDCHDGQLAFDGWGIQDYLAEPFIRKAIEESGADLILYPDEGARNRYGEYGLPTINCEKDRDPTTGKIRGLYTSVDNALLFKGKRVLIVDDILDGGATFIRAANLATAYGAARIYAYATHSIFSKGISPLIDANIDRIYTTNSVLRRYVKYGDVTEFDVTELLTNGATT